MEKWVGEPPRARLRKWERVCAELASTPNEWFMVEAFDSETSANGARQCLKRNGAEVQVRKTYQADEWRVFARWVT